MTPVVQFPHDVSSQVSITSLLTVGNEPNEEVVTINLEPDLLQGASQDMIPSTSTGITSSQAPITDPASVISAKTKPKGRAAKKQHHLETLDSNTAQKYVDMVEIEPVSNIKPDTPINVYTCFCLNTAKSKFSLVSPVADW